MDGLTWRASHAGRPPFVERQYPKPASADCYALRIGKEERSKISVHPMWKNLAL